MPRADPISAAEAACTGPDEPWLSGVFLLAFSFLFHCSVLAWLAPSARAQTSDPPSQRAGGQWKRRGGAAV